MEGAAACGLAGVAAPLGAEVISCMVSARQSAPRNWAQLGPLDGATLARFVFGMFVWEGLFRAVQAAVWRQKEGRSAAREERELWHTSVPSYAVSTVHALILCWRGAGHLSALWGASEAEKHVIVPGGHAYAASQQVELSNWAFLTYLCYDLSHVLAVYPRLGGMDTVLHHAAFLLCAILAGSQRAFNFAFGWLVLCEASTPVLNLRWFFKTMQRRDASSLARAAAALGFRSLPRVELCIDCVLCAVFLLARVVGYALGLTHLLRAAWIGYYAPVSQLAARTMLTLVTLGFGLNLVWARKLVAGVRRSLARTQAYEGVNGKAKAR